MLIISTSANAVIGPIKISLNNEYRTATPVIGSIATTIKLDKEDIKNITIKINRVIEKMILQNPKQWIWSHNRWK